MLLDVLRDLDQSVNGKPADWKYRTMWGFVAQHGHAWINQPKPKKYH
jgi:hypothetical protein